MKALIAEEGRACTEQIAGVLLAMGVPLIETDDGAEADRWLRSDPSIRLLICERDLPRLSGLELCRRVRDRQRPLYIYTILLTDGTSLQDRLRCFEAGADDCLVKPFHEAEFAARLQAAQRILSTQAEALERSVELDSLRRELERRNAVLTEQAITDPLTALRNRRHFHSMLELHFQAAVREEQPLSLILLDIDQFKPYNDTFGHQAGDDILRTVGAELRQNIRNRDLVARYGGEEFVILVPDGDAEAARSLAERLRASIAERPWPDWPITVSLGIATLNPTTPTPALLLEHADRALYQAKRAGRNRVAHNFELPDGDNQRQTTAPSKAKAKANGRLEGFHAQAMNGRSAAAKPSG